MTLSQARGKHCVFEPFQGESELEFHAKGIQVTSWHLPPRGPAQFSASGGRELADFEIDHFEIDPNGKGAVKVVVAR